MNEKAFGVLETLLSILILALSAYLLLSRIPEQKKQTMAVSSSSNCESFANTLITNVRNQLDQTEIRSFFPLRPPEDDFKTAEEILTVTQEPEAWRAIPSDFPSDRYCTENRSSSVCDTQDHFILEPSRPYTTNNEDYGQFQNIRNSVTWAGNLYDQYNVPGTCRAEFEFNRNDGTLSGLGQFMPEEMPSLNELFSSGQLPVLQVKMSIEQIKLGGEIDPQTECVGSDLSSRRPHLVKPNNGYGFRLGFKIQHLKVWQGGYSNTENLDPKSITNCETKTLLVYAPDSSLAKPTIYAQNGLAHAVAENQNVCERGNTNSNVRNIIINFKYPNVYLDGQGEAKGDGGLLLCKDFYQPGLSRENLCYASQVLEGISRPPRFRLYKSATPTPTIAAQIYYFQLPRRNQIYEVSAKYLDTASLCQVVGTSSTCAQQFHFFAKDFCEDSDYLNLFCPNVRVPNGCGDGDCGYGSKPLKCPQSGEYYSCEDRCDLDCQVKCPKGEKSIEPLLPVSSRLICKGVILRGPCGTEEIHGEYDDCDEERLCNDEIGSCGVKCGGREGKSGCDDQGNRIDGSSGSFADSDRHNICETGRNYCPPTYTYCSNFKMKDICGNACPEGTRPAKDCCDKCDSSLNLFESTEECQNSEKGFRQCQEVVTGAGRCVKGLDQISN